KPADFSRKNYSAPGSTARPLNPFPASDHDRKSGRRAAQRQLVSRLQRALLEQALEGDPHACAGRVSVHRMRVHATLRLTAGVLDDLPHHELARLVKHVVVHVFGPPANSGKAYSQ